VRDLSGLAGSGRSRVTGPSSGRAQAGAASTGGDMERHATGDTFSGFAVARLQCSSRPSNPIRNPGANRENRQALLPCDRGND